MPCRVGITTDPERREKEWREDYPHLWGWHVKGPFNSKIEAQNLENKLAKDLNCQSHPGGSGSENDQWYVYSFYYS